MQYSILHNDYFFKWFKLQQNLQELKLHLVKLKITQMKILFFFFFFFFFAFKEQFDQTPM